MILNESDKKILISAVNRYLEFLEGHRDNIKSGNLDSEIATVEDKERRLNVVETQIVYYTTIYNKIQFNEELSKQEVNQIVVACNTITQLMLNDRDNLTEAIKYLDSLAAELISEYL